MQGNLIGTNATGSGALPNEVDGVVIEGENDNLIGGTTAGARNVISGNTESGVHLLAAASGNTVQGNYLGLDALGTSDLGNGQNGVLISDASGNTIGGTTAGAGNVLSGNLFGIQVTGSAAVGNQIQGNRIGTDPTGTLALGNSEGILLTSDSTDTLIGGAGSAGNIIAFNDGPGVIIASGTGNHIFGNSHFSNGVWALIYSADRRR